jgi:hypothetical protein
LTPEQRALWQRRELTAQNTLEIQAMAGTSANAETMAHFQRYVRGEISLTEAITQAREQLAQEHDAFRQYLNRRNII